MKKIHILLLLMLSCNAQGQNLLTPEKAVEIALKNNFEILVADNEVTIAQLNNTKGNAGMLPTININSSGDYSYNNTYQKLSSGTINEYTSQSTVSISANAELSWTLFDGGKMFVTKNKLAEMQALGEIQFQSKVLDVMYNVIAAYYDIVKQKQQLKSMNEAISYNKERVIIAETGFTAGSLVKTDLLQAKIDLNVAAENAINQQYTIHEAQKSLNLILGQDATTPFEISDSIPLSYSPDKNELLLKLNSSNASILSFRKQIDVAQLTAKETRKAYSPILSFKGGYYASQNTNTEGSTLKNRSYGPLIGATLSIPLYNGGESKRKIAIAKEELQSAQYNLEDATLQANIELQNALTDFENQQRLLQIEKENNQLAKENLEISLQRLRLGQTTSLEVHQAQESYVQSSTRLINFKYNLKIGETKLKQLVSSL